MILTILYFSGRDRNNMNILICVAIAITLNSRCVKLCYPSTCTGPCNGPKEACLGCHNYCCYEDKQPLDDVRCCLPGSKRSLTGDTCYFIELYSSLSSSKTSIYMDFGLNYFIAFFRGLSWFISFLLF